MSYSGSQLSEVQEPHPQPPPRKQGGDYDVPHVISKRYSTNILLIRSEFSAFKTLRFYTGDVLRKFSRTQLGLSYLHLGDLSQNNDPHLPQSQEICWLLKVHVPTYP